MAVAYIVVIPHKRLLKAIPISFLLGVIYLVIAEDQEPVGRAVPLKAPCFLSATITTAAATKPHPPHRAWTKRLLLLGIMLYAKWQIYLPRCGLGPAYLTPIG